MGGAEMMLYKLLSSMNRERFVPEVISLRGGGEIRSKIEGLGIDVYSLGMEKGYADFTGLARLIKRFRQRPPNIIQTWLHHADFLGGLIGKLATDAPIVWNIRNSKLEPAITARGTIWMVKAGAFLSAFIPARIICGSLSAWNDHIELGYKKDKMVVIQNGFDLERFHPDPAARLSVRNELGLAPETEVVGIFTRTVPYKDLGNFVQSAAYLRTQRPQVRFVMCGREIEWDYQPLVTLIEQAGLRDHCYLLGKRQDVPRLMAAMDVVVLSSQSEGFPNVLGEAMACGVPCAATEAGDASLIIGDTGKVVPIKDPMALAKACEALLSMGLEARQRMGSAARQRIAEHFSLPVIAQKYEQLYIDLLSAQSVHH